MQEEEIMQVPVLEVAAEEGEEVEMQRRRTEFMCSKMSEGYRQRFVFPEILSEYAKHLLDCSNFMACNNILPFESMSASFLVLTKFKCQNASFYGLFT